MTAHPALPAVSVDPYLAECIADELALARLLGYKPDAPHEITPNCTIWASKGTSFASFSGPGTRSNDKVWLPKWRRGNDCFELIALCKVSVMFCEDRVVAGVTGQYMATQASFADHPTKDAAIRFAMCKAAIAYLTSESTTTKAAP